MKLFFFFLTILRILSGKVTPTFDSLNQDFANNVNQDNEGSFGLFHWYIR